VSLDLCLDVHTIALENRSSSPPHRATLAAARAACRSGAELSHAAGERSRAKIPTPLGPRRMGTRAAQGVGAARWRSVPRKE
jgi:hypothetical protein